MKVIDKLRQLIIGINLQGEKHAEGKEVRTIGLKLAAIARKPGQLLETIKGIGEAAEAHAAEAATWLTTDQIVAGESGPFDSCDLTAWLAIAEKAGVTSVPARAILHLTEEEAEIASGVFSQPTGAIPDRIRKRVRDTIAAEQQDFDALTGGQQPTGAIPDRIRKRVRDTIAAEQQDFDALTGGQQPTSSEIDREELQERLYACMDDVPEGWMVRTSQCGGSELKALSGTGIAGDTTPEVKFGPDLEIGPGWVRNGNRRRVNTSDRRTLQAHASGPHRGMTFLARPWQEAARYVVADDPHRHGSPFEGPGRWPMEWRAFIKQGKCIGVSVYYAWAGEATPENARVALEVRDLAQRIVDAALAQGLEPRLMDIQHAIRNPSLAQMLIDKGFGPGEFSCTLDFIETKDGLMLLEGGPGNTPLGGGHPCGFAGTGGKPTLGNPMDTTGVAFRPMPHVLIGEPATWEDGDRTDCILEWEAVEKLAAQ